MDQTQCNEIGASCDYPVNGGCGDYQCQCDPVGIWSCSESTCIDAGTPIDAGPPPFDAGVFPDAGFPSCPPEQPAGGSACFSNGEVCGYGLCPTNCLCDSGAWVCAAQAPCLGDGG
jgi:hypothetical protein